MALESERDSLTRPAIRGSSANEKGFYRYMGRIALKIIVIYFVIITPLVLLVKHFVDLENIFLHVTDRLSDAGVLIIFTASESFLGLIPPDIFAIWSMKFEYAYLILVMLGVLSYTGGIISYYIGHGLAMTSRVKRFTEKALRKYIKLVQKWGGAFVVIAALFPFTPYSMIIIALSMLKFPLNSYLIYGLARLPRFVILGVFYIHLMNLDGIVS